MLTKSAIAIVAVLVLTSSSASLAATPHRTAPGWSDGAAGFVPGSKAQQDWFARASRSGNGF
jgi:hypothetical protein